MINIDALYDIVFILCNEQHAMKFNNIRETYSIIQYCICIYGDSP